MKKSIFLSLIFIMCFVLIGCQEKEPETPVVPPVNAPTKPISWTFCTAPLASKFPNPVKGTVAPAPAKSTKC